jgi:hypothetical protein
MATEKQLAALAKARSARRRYAAARKARAAVPRLRVSAARPHVYLVRKAGKQRGGRRMAYGARKAERAARCAAGLDARASRIACHGVCRTTTKRRSRAAGACHRQCRTDYRLPKGRMCKRGSY